MKRVMISGHFNPFHDMHLDYIEQGMEQGDFIICVVSSDEQVLMKKKKKGIPEEARARIVDLILEGLKVKHLVLINHFDNDGLVAEALKAVSPDVFLRGGDKTEEDFPKEERQVCIDCGIMVRYAKFKVNRHGALL